MCKNILEDMIKAIKGLQNIQKTYKEDKLFYCNIETIIENIHFKLSEIKQKDPELFKIKGIFSDEALETIFESPTIKPIEPPQSQDLQAIKKNKA
jgi:hypothetical protein